MFRVYLPILHCPIECLHLQPHCNKCNLYLLSIIPNHSLPPLNPLLFTGFNPRSFFVFYYLKCVLILFSYPLLPVSLKIRATSPSASKFYGSISASVTPSTSSTLTPLPYTSLKPHNIKPPGKIEEVQHWQQDLFLLTVSYLPFLGLGSKTG